MKLIQGTAIAKKLLSDLTQEVAASTHRKPGLAFIRVGDHEASKLYIRKKKEKCTEVGFLSFDHELPQNASHQQVVDCIQMLNSSAEVDGILLQLPLPEHLDPLPLLETIDPQKDIDGFHPLNMGKLLLGQEGGFIPCTPRGIHHLLTASDIPIAGKHVVILGRSNIVGKPLAAMLLQKHSQANATVTVAHSHSDRLRHLCLEADILVVAIGKPHFVTASMVQPGTTVIDVGINKIGTQDHPKIVGDVDFEQVSPLCEQITPVPGGVGPMTIAYLLKNTWESYQRRALR